MRWRDAIAALVAGTFVSAFHISEHGSLLTAGSALLLGTILTLPIVAGVVVANAALAVAGMRRHARLVSAGLISLYLVLALRGPILDSEPLVALARQLDGGAWAMTRRVLLVALAMAGTIVIWRHVGKATAALGVLAALMLLLMLRTGADGGMEQRKSEFEGVMLDRKPGIYLILSDSFSSLKYMKDAGIDISGFESRLIGRGFRLHEDAFSNYHPTTSSMLSMLQMQHHHYRNQDTLVAGRSARQVIAGGNELSRLLSRNGYRTEYVHQTPYLLFEGCTADYCYPRDYDSQHYARARSALRELLPRYLAKRMPYLEWENPPGEVIRHEVAARLAASVGSSDPLFLYIHLFEPSHVENDRVGRCDEQEELAGYAGRVASAVVTIESLIESIIANDPAAVIVVGGDHGPFITNRCERYVDIRTPVEYRDRVGVLTAIRWPEDYDGRFDANIRTNVNLFRYVLASLIDGSTEALAGRARDDVFVHGSGRHLQVLDDGKVLVPSVEFSSPDATTDGEADR